MTAHETWAHHDDPKENVSPWNMNYGIQSFICRKSIKMQVAVRKHGYSFWNANIVTCIDFFGSSTISTLQLQHQNTQNFEIKTKPNLEAQEESSLATWTCQASINMSRPKGNCKTEPHYFPHLLYKLRLGVMQQSSFPECKEYIYGYLFDSNKLKELSWHD